MNLVVLPTHDASGNVNVVVETPRGSCVKIKYEVSLEAFKLSRPLALGVAYPFDWGFIPSTRAADGDPLDAMVYHDVPTYPGLVIACRPLGVVKLRQKEPGTPRVENDRILVVPAHEERWRDARRLHERVREELEQFFAIVVSMTPKKVRVTAWTGPKAAQKLIAKACRDYGRG